MMRLLLLPFRLLAGLILLPFKIVGAIFAGLGVVLTFVIGFFLLLPIILLFGIVPIIVLIFLISVVFVAVKGILIV